MKQANQYAHKKKGSSGTSTPDDRLWEGDKLWFGEKRVRIITVTWQRYEQVGYELQECTSTAFIYPIFEKTKKEIDELFLSGKLTKT